MFIEKVFLTFCVLSTIISIIYCVYQYALNEDSSVISFKKYHETENDIYPAITLCFSDYVKSNLFKNASEESRYKAFLGGKYWDDKFHEMKFEHSVKMIIDYLIKASITTYNLEDNEYFYYEYTNQSTYNNWKPRFYRNLMMTKYSALSMCWTFELDYISGENVERFTLNFKSSILKDSFRRPFGNLALFITYPGQMSAQTAHVSMWKPTNRSTISMEFNIQNVVVLQQRKSFRKSCNTDWKRNDEFILQRTTEITKCTPMFFPLNSSLPFCKNSSEALDKLNEIVKKIQPCRKIEKVLFSFNEYYNNIDKEDLGVDENTDVLEFSFLFQGSTFTEIEQIRSYSLQSLVGNAGGYVGLFLGAAVSQLPNALLRLKIYLKV